MSAGSVGDAYDTASAETITGLYKTEVIEELGPWQGVTAVELETPSWVEWFSNRRLLGPIGSIPPAEFEVLYDQGQARPLAVARPRQSTPERESGRFTGRPNPVRATVDCMLVQLGGRMPYRVHRLAVDEDTAQEKLEQFLNQMEGELSAVIPYPVPKFLAMGAASKVKFLLVVERTLSS